MLELEIDQNQWICKKILSDAEVLHRRKPTTNQTHIGLFEKSVILDRVIMPSLLIYNNQSFDTLTIMDPITNPDGTVRSPKARQGTYKDQLIFEGKSYVSTYVKINEIIENDDKYNKSRNDFSIIYGTLTNKRLFFILYNNQSSNLKKLSNYLNYDEIMARRLLAQPKQELYKKLYLTSKELLKSHELEESVNESFDFIKQNIPTSRYITKDEAALIQKIGKTGEGLINKYLTDKKNKKEIKDFFWLSNDQPNADHDFEVTEMDNNIKFIEVKSTKLDFDTQFYWSRNERNLFLRKPNNYILNRISHVFDDQNVSLSVGENMLSLHKKLNISGINFEGSTVFPSKIDINWKVPISLKKLL